MKKLTPDELEILEKFRSLNNEGKKLTLRLVTAYSECESLKSDAAPVKRINPPGGSEDAKNRREI